jgi:hypothetical protein
MVFVEFNVGSVKIKPEILHDPIVVLQGVDGLLGVLVPHKSISRNGPVNIATAQQQSSTGQSSQSSIFRGSINRSFFAEDRCNSAVSHDCTKHMFAMQTNIEKKCIIFMIERFCFLNKSTGLGKLSRQKRLVFIAEERKS